MTRAAVFTVFGTALALGLAYPLSAQGEMNPAPTDSPVNVWQVYKYRMAGKVRLLLFWVGKDNVGGGTIAFGRQGSDDRRGRTDAVEVLFGSNPSRVPGKINRWGYGREWAEWRDTGDGQPPSLISTTFEGFMRHSSEESLSEVRSNASKDKEKNVFWFDGIRSSVSDSGASATIHFFSQQQEFDYTNPAGVECAYRQRLRGGPPDRQRSLPKERAKYGRPYGFLTGLRALMDQVSERYAQKEAGRPSFRPSLQYGYNAKGYRLAVRDLSLEKSFQLGSGDSKHGGLRFTDIIKADFEVTNLKTRETHGFSIWYPVSGPLKGVPLKIVDKPRWWLRIELTLDPQSAKSGGATQSYGAMPECAQQATAG
jgi:hypothetical protein